MSDDGRNSHDVIVRQRTFPKGTRHKGAEAGRARIPDNGGRVETVGREAAYMGIGCVKNSLVEGYHTKTASGVGCRTAPFTVGWC